MMTQSEYLIYLRKEYEKLQSDFIQLSEKHIDLIKIRKKEVTNSISLQKKYEQLQDEFIQLAEKHIALLGTKNEEVISLKNGLSFPVSLN